MQAKVLFLVVAVLTVLSGGKSPPSHRVYRASQFHSFNGVLAGFGIRQGLDTMLQLRHACPRFRIATTDG